MARVLMLVMSLVAATLSACTGDTPAPLQKVISSVTCHGVFGGDFQACYGPRWDEPTDDLSRNNDGYVIELVEPSHSGKRIISRKDVAYRTPLAWWGLDEETRLHFETKDPKQVCFEVSDPPTCLDVPVTSQSAPNFTTETDVQRVAMLQSSISLVSATQLGDGSLVGERLKEYDSSEFPWRGEGEDIGGLVEYVVFLEGEEVVLRWRVGEGASVIPANELTERFMVDGLIQADL